MIALNSRNDGYKFLFPKEFIVDDIRDKYAEILLRANSFFTEPIDFLNETIKNIELLGFNGATQLQGLTSKLFGLHIEKKVSTYPSAEYQYRSATSPLALIDKTFTVTFRHTLGFVNYFLMFENFFYLYARDHKSKDMIQNFKINILNLNGSIYSRVVLMNPIIDGIESLPLNYTLPVANNSEFKVTFKYSNIDFQFLPTLEDDFHRD